MVVEGAASDAGKSGGFIVVSGVVLKNGQSPSETCVPSSLHIISQQPFLKITSPGKHPTGAAGGADLAWLCTLRSTTAIPA